MALISRDGERKDVLNEIVRSDGTRAMLLAINVSMSVHPTDSLSPTKMSPHVLLIPPFLLLVDCIRHLHKS